MIEAPPYRYSSKAISMSRFRLRIELVPAVL
jgi:hypothetical protein